MIYFSTLNNERITNDKKGFLSHFDGKYKTDSIQDFSKYLLRNHIGIGCFKDNRKLTSAFMGSNLLSYDFDDGNIHSQDVIKKLLDLNLNYVIAGSKNHNKDKGDGKGVIERFHLFVFLDQLISDVDYYKFILKAFKSGLNIQSDPACTDVTRYYFKHSSIIGYNDTGSPIITNMYRAAYDSFVMIKEKERRIKEEREKMKMDITDEDKQLLMNHIIDSLETSIEGQGGDHNTYVAGIKIYALGGTFSDYQTYNTTKCVPQWNLKSLQRKWDDITKKVTRKPEAYIKKVLFNIKGNIK